MALSFPNNPTTNQEYSLGTRTWRWDGAKWNLINSGIKGADGTDGTDGKSAYEIAVENGFEGTEQQWNDSLPGEDGRELEFRVNNDGILQQRYVGDAGWTDVFSLAEYLSVDRFPPYISDRTITTSETTDELTINFVKAKDTATPQEGLVYTYYEGDEQLLNSLDTIESQTLRATATNVSQFVVPVTEGDFVSGNVLVIDQAGNPSIYEAFSTVIPEQSIQEVTIQTGDFTLENGGLNNDSFEFGVDVVASENADDTATVQSSNPVVVITALGNNQFRASLAEGFSESTSASLVAIANFDGTESETVTVTCTFVAYDETTESAESFEFETVA